VTQSTQHTKCEVAGMTGRSSFVYRTAERGSIKPLQANPIKWDLAWSNALQT
jgi:hypothetical protein